MYRHHQGATLLESALSGNGETGVDEWKVPELTESVSEKDGVITITVNNLSLTDAKDLTVQFAEDKTYEVVEAGIVTSTDVHDHNTFEAPDTVKEEAFAGYRAEGKNLVLSLPKASVVMIRVK